MKLKCFRVPSHRGYIPAEELAHHSLAVVGESDTQARYFLSPEDSKIWNKAVSLEAAFEFITGIPWPEYVDQVISACREGIDAFIQLERQVANHFRTAFEPLLLHIEECDTPPPDWVEIAYDDQRYIQVKDFDVSAVRYKVRSLFYG
jgi:hypothetical protein